MNELYGFCLGQIDPPSFSKKAKDFLQRIETEANKLGLSLEQLSGSGAEEYEILGFIFAVAVRGLISLVAEAENEEEPSDPDPTT